MKKNVTFLSCLLLIFSCSTYAQRIDGIGAQSPKDIMVSTQEMNGSSTSGDLKNIIKINLSALVFKNISLQYERVIKRKMSVALGVAITPKTGLPFKKTLMDEFGHNEDARRAIESTKLSNFTITPEIRFYVGRKAAPAGFYVAPFLRYNSMHFEQLYEFTASNGKLYHPFITGTINNFGGGILFGAQWHLSKKLTLDWWIAGPSYGTLSGNLSGTEDMSDMSAADKQDLETDIEDVDLPLIKTDATVGNNRVDVKLSGSYVGLRTFGFAIGYNF